MKILARLVITVACCGYLSNRVTGLFFDENTLSYILGYIALGVPTSVATAATLDWAFEVKVADVHLNGEKVGTIRDEDKK